MTTDAIRTQRYGDLRSVDPAIAEIIEKETLRQERNLELIASENVTSRAVREAVGSVMTDKYAEGYPGKRYYGGCEFHDEAESLAIERAKALFGAEHANVQPHCGASANMTVFYAFMTPGDAFLGMDLAHGGHLTHGSPVNFSGRLYKAVHYGVSRETEQLDYDQIRSLAREHRPKIVLGGATCYPRDIDWAALRSIADEVGAYLMVDMAHPAGLIAAGEYPSPVPFADFVTSTTHKTLRGPRGGLILCKAEHAQAIDKSVFPGLQGGPLMHQIAGKAVCFHEALQPEFKSYQKQVKANARALAGAMAEQGFRAVSGGTDSHLALIDLTPFGITGKKAQETLDRASITVNRNMIPFDPQKPFVTSGIRIGTPVVTSRGMREGEMAEIARLIAQALRDPDSEENLSRTASAVHELTARFPVHLDA
ncbi:MAG: serine hydroxymethyltransferase [Armatimonadetes bacterium]|nr:serine hydroxymethyltransferase [Armatimonadota bacterium]